MLVLLEVPSLRKVVEWRQLQEQRLRESGNAHGEGMRNEEIVSFVQHYERITRHILTEMPTRADLRLRLGDDHQICEVIVPAKSSLAEPRRPGSPD